MADTGRGIPQDQLEKIFEHFFTAKEVGKGTGLGLSQVYGFIKQSDGEITVDSEVGVGTTFTLTLPKANVDHVPVQASRGSTNPAPGWRLVLVVEDNADVGDSSHNCSESWATKQA